MIATLIYGERTIFNIGIISVRYAVANTPYILSWWFG